MSYTCIETRFERAFEIAGSPEFHDQLLDLEESVDEAVLADDQQLISELMLELAELVGDAK